MNTPIKIKVKLKDLPHKCTRTLLVPQSTNMRQLHFIIQDAMGWLNAHLFEFTDAKVRSSLSIGMPDEFDDDFGLDSSAQKLDAHNVKLKGTFLEENNGKAFWYWYDFGDDWWHQISFLKVSQKDLKSFKDAPLCLKAQGKCPPEDVGGPWGYAEFLTNIKDKSHPENQELREWYGLEKNESYEEDKVNLEAINEYLQNFYSSEEWKSETYDLF